MPLSYPLKPSIKNLARRLAKVQVLIADGDAEVSLLVRDVLQYAGFTQIHMARHGEHALEIMKSHDIDLLITDWGMSPMDGISLIHHLRNSPDSVNPYIPIIMLTGKAERKDVQAARDTGVTEFVVKPFSAKTLFERLVIVVENPRSFIVSKHYSGPDRRRRTDIPPAGTEERRHQTPFGA